MAKLTAPCLSLDARGKLANSLVFAGWKGIKYARQYVVPANPNSAAQQTQRGYITSALALWHDTTYQINALDKSNLDRAAGYSGRTMSGFNLYVKNYIDTKVAGVTPQQIFDQIEVDVGAGTVQVTVQSVANTVSVGMVWGYSPTAMLYSITRTEAAVPGALHTFDNPTPTAGQVIYYKIYDLTANSLVQLGTGRITVTA